MFYHVRIFAMGLSIDKKFSYKLRYNISHDAVIAEYVVPQLTGMEMHIGGKIAAPAPERTVQIWETEQKAVDFGREHLVEYQKIKESYDLGDDPQFIVTKLGRDVTDDLFTEARKPRPINREGYDSKRVFVVHGHDRAVLAESKEFLMKMELSPIVLSDQVNTGKTIVEKLESNTDVGYAIVLLTPDDLGGKKPTDGSDLSPSPRARQNVILELGYLMAKLGRNRVSVVFTPGIEKPSDIDGLGYLEMDSRGHWFTLIAKEMKAVGIDVDMNRL